MNLSEGTFLQGGRYRIDGVLGQGGFGITYLGVQVALDRKVAIKEFFMKDLHNRDTNTSQVYVGSNGSREQVERFRQKFIKEARNIFRLKHRHIIPVIDVFEENGTAYYVMEQISGGSLSDKVKRCALPESVAVRYIRQVAEALDFVHSQRMMHLDVKPANILVDENDNAVLIDFGLAKQYDTEGQQTSSTPVGISHGYAPLEQYKRGGVSTFSPATDIYSLGATLFKLVTGVTPPEASDVNDEGLPVLPSDISPAVCGAIETAMEPRRKDRPQSIAEFLELLKDSKDFKDSSDPKELKNSSEETVALKVTKDPNEETRLSGENVVAAIATNRKPVAVIEETKQNKCLRWVKSFVLLSLVCSIISSLPYCLRYSGEESHLHGMFVAKYILLFAVSLFLIFVLKDKKAETGAAILSLAELLFLLSSIDFSEYFGGLGNFTWGQEHIVDLYIYFNVIYAVELLALVLSLCGIYRLMKSCGVGKIFIKQYTLCSISHIILFFSTNVYSLINFFRFENLFEISYSSKALNINLGATAWGLGQLIVFFTLCSSIYLLVLYFKKFKPQNQLSIPCQTNSVLLMRTVIISLLALFILPYFGGYECDSEGCVCYNLLLGYNAYGYSNFPEFDLWPCVVFISIIINFLIGFIKPVKWFARITSVASMVFFSYVLWSIYDWTESVEPDATIYPTLIFAIILSWVWIVLTFVSENSKDSNANNSGNAVAWVVAVLVSVGVVWLITNRSYDAEDYNYVDLGLPSGVKWADCNVGADKSNEYGDYLTWDEVDESGLRLPTREEMQELLDCCSWNWTTYNGVEGYEVIGPNDNSIFLPAAGCRGGTELETRGIYGRYWSGTDKDYPINTAYYMAFYYYSGAREVVYATCDQGFSVRPVSD